MSGTANSNVDHSSGDQTYYSLLNDQPAEPGEADCLGTGEIAEGLGQMILESRSAAPFVLAIDAGWGMGKSTLMRRLEDNVRRLPGVRTTRFNAWTAGGEQALEGLIKSVLEQLDAKSLRGAVRRFTKNRHVSVIARVATAIVGRLLGVSKLVDTLWEQLARDPRARNEFRDRVHKMLTDWLERGPSEEKRAMVVFVDDLDRCSDAVVVKVCEAVKLYLDAPGLIFVISCDQSILARGVSNTARGGVREGRSYLEKIVQVAYRMPLPKQEQIDELIRVCARRSGTAGLIVDSVALVLAERSGRNPRRIKRIINSFILEHQLSPEWRLAPLAGTPLVTAVLLQHLYAGFYDLLVSDEFEDPIGQFLDYVHLRERAAAPPPEDDEWWNSARMTLAAHHIALAEPSGKPLTDELERLEKVLPEQFGELARERAFVELLKGVAEENTRLALRAQLVSRPLATDAAPDESAFASAASFQSGPPDLTGLRIFCVDDNPASLDVLRSRLAGLGADVTVFDDRNLSEVDKRILTEYPDAVISDIRRGENDQAGFEHVEQLRRRGYGGSVIFFTGNITPERRTRSRELGATDIVTAESEVVQSFGTLAGLKTKPGAPLRKLAPS